MKKAADRTILIMGVVLFLVGLGKDIVTKDLGRTDLFVRRTFGILVAMISLTLLSGPAPKLARAFAILAGVTAVIAEGAPLFTTVSQATTEGITRETLFQGPSGETAVRQPTFVPRQPGDPGQLGTLDGVPIQGPAPVR